MAGELFQAMRPDHPIRRLEAFVSGPNGPDPDRLVAGYVGPQGRDWDLEDGLAALAAAGWTFLYEASPRPWQPDRLFQANIPQSLQERVQKLDDAGRAILADALDPARNLIEHRLYACLADFEPRLPGWPDDADPAALDRLVPHRSGLVAPVEGPGTTFRAVSGQTGPIDPLTAARFLAVDGRRTCGAIDEQVRSQFGANETPETIRRRWLDLADQGFLLLEALDPRQNVDCTHLGPVRHRLDCAVPAEMGPKLRPARHLHDRRHRPERPPIRGPARGAPEPPDSTRRRVCMLSGLFTRRRNAKFRILIPSISTINSNRRPALGVCAPVGTALVSFGWRCRALGEGAGKPVATASRSGANTRSTTAIDQDNPMAIRLMALDEGPDIPVDRAVVVVGRHPQCDARIDSIRVSRRHCCMTTDNGEVVVRDLGSTNGIRINGQRVEMGRLRSGDRALDCPHPVSSRHGRPAGDDIGGPLVVNVYLVVFGPDRVPAVCGAGFHAAAGEPGAGPGHGRARASAPGNGRALQDPGDRANAARRGRVRSGAFRRMSARFVPLTSGVAAPIIALQRPVLLVGRHPDCDVRIDLPEISRRHCCLAQAYDRLLIRDLGSRNGVRVNGRLVSEVQLVAGDEIAIAQVLYRLEAEPAPAAPSRPPAAATSPPPASPGLSKFTDEDDDVLVPLDDDI